jgi:hypothetical protein
MINVKFIQPVEPTLDEFISTRQKEIKKKSIESQSCHDVPDPIQWNDVCFWNGKEP